MTAQEGTATNLVVGLFNRASDAELALDNLDEAEYEAAGISVVAANPALARLLTRVPGPLSRLSAAEFVQRLTALGLNADDAVAYGAGLAAGGIAVAVESPAGSEDSAGEILRDQKALHVSILRGDPASA